MREHLESPALPRAQSRPHNPEPRLFSLVTRYSLLVTLLLSSSVAVAYDYQVAVLVDDEDDIYELAFSEEISDTERDTLLEMFRNPLDLNRASRDALYNLPGLTYAMVDAILARRADEPFTSIAELEDIEGITDDIYEQLEPFVRVVRPRKKGVVKRVPIRGKVRAKAADRIRDKGTSSVSRPDTDWPEAYVRVEVEEPGVWEAGAVVTLENTLADIKGLGSTLEMAPVIPDPNNEGQFKTYDNRYFLETSGETWLPAWPKVYARMMFDDVDVLVGSYRVGFGQRLLFDSIGRENPYGFVPDLYVSEGEYSFSMYKGQYGAVATIPLATGGGVRLEATPFFSWWRYDAYQYDVKHAVSEEMGCVPGISDPEDCYYGYVVLEPLSDFEHGVLVSQSLPRAWSELIGGANLTLHFDERSHVGLTGYASMIDFHLDDPATVFSSSVDFPERDFFYAAGADVAWGIGDLAVYAEGALMDNVSYAGIARALWEVGDWVLEANGRYYDIDYDNPHSRGYAASDQFEGNRRAGERGGMLSLKYRPAKWLTVRLDEDIWSAPVWKDSDLKNDTEYPWRMETYLRVDTVPVDKVRFGVFVQLNDRDLSSHEDGDEYYGSDTPARGEKYQWGAQASTRLVPNSQFWVYYKQSFRDAGENMDAEHYAVGKLRIKPLAFAEKKWERLLIADVRAKYFEGNFDPDGFLTDVDTADRYFEGYVQLGTTIMKNYSLSLRGAIREHFEKEDRYGERTKKATEWFWKAMMEVKF